MSFHKDSFHQYETKTLTWHMNDMHKKIHELLKMIQEIDIDLDKFFTRQKQQEERITDIEERFVEER